MWTPSAVTSSSRDEPETPPLTTDDPPVGTRSMLPSTDSADTLQSTPAAPAADTAPQFDQRWADTTTAAAATPPFMATDTLDGASGFPAPTPPYRSRADDSLTSPRDFGGGSVIASSVVTASVSEMITENEATTTTDGYVSPYGNYS